jgi:transposase
MKELATIGVDIAKNVFQLHGIDAEGNVILRRKVKRRDFLTFFTNLHSCLIGMEACSSAHHWGRELTELGHSVKLMPAVYVKPYVKRQKNDATDAEAICEAVTRPTMRFVEIKSEDQQAVLMMHRARQLLIRQRTMLVNALRAHIAELGMVSRQGITGANQLIALIECEEDKSIPNVARTALTPLVRQLRTIQREVDHLQDAIQDWHKQSDLSMRLENIPGIGPITASALAATVTNPEVFKSGRQLAAWIGLVPRQNSSGGKTRLGRITKQGDPYLRRLLVLGAHAVLRFRQHGKAASTRWAASLLERKPYMVCAVALANKMARVVWAIMMHGSKFEVQRA